MATVYPSSDSYFQRDNVPCRKDLIISNWFSECDVNMDQNLRGMFSAPRVSDLSIYLLWKQLALTFDKFLRFLSKSFGIIKSMIVFLFFINIHSQYAFNNSKAVAIIFGSFTVLAKMSSSHWPKENLLAAKEKNRAFICLIKCPGDRGDETIKQLWGT